MQLIQPKVMKWTTTTLPFKSAMVRGLLLIHLEAIRKDLRKIRGFRRRRDNRTPVLDGSGLNDGALNTAR